MLAHQNKVAEQLHAIQLMARLVEDLRTLSLSDAGKLTLSKQPLDLRKVVGRVASAFLAQAEEKGVELKPSGTE